MNKYICPACGSKLRYWNEYYFYKVQTVDPITGKLSAKACNTAPCEANCGDMHGFECTECDWSVNVTNEVVPGCLGELMDTEQFKKDLKV